MDREVSQFGNYYRLTPVEKKVVEAQAEDLLDHKGTNQPTDGSTILYISLRAEANTGAVSQLESLGFEVKNRRIKPVRRERQRANGRLTI